MTIPHFSMPTKLVTYLTGHIHTYLHKYCTFDNVYKNESKK